MNKSLERRAAGNGRVACIAAAPLEESTWKIRARSASVQFDHTVLAELIARRWKQDRPYLAREVLTGLLVQHSSVVAKLD
jgi:hypothetical protein